MIYSWQFWVVLYGLAMFVTFFLCARAEGRFQAGEKKNPRGYGHCDTYYAKPDEWGNSSSAIDVPVFFIVLVAPISLIFFFFAGLKNIYRYLVEVNKTNANL